MNIRCDIEPTVVWHTNTAGAQNPHGSKGRAGLLIEGRHTNLGSVHKPPGTAQRTHNPQRAGGKTKQVHINLATMQREARGAETSPHKSRDAECCTQEADTSAHKPPESQNKCTQAL